jgi:hypothetical protein
VDTADENDEEDEALTEDEIKSGEAKYWLARAENYENKRNSLIGEGKHEAATQFHLESLKTKEKAKKLYNLGMKEMSEDDENKAKEFFKQAAELGSCLAQSEYANFFEGKEWLNWTLRAAYSGSYEDVQFLKLINPLIMKQENSEKALQWVLDNKDGEEFSGSDSLRVKSFLQRFNVE